MAGWVEREAEEFRAEVQKVFDENDGGTVKVPNYNETPAHLADVNGRVSREPGDIASKAIGPSIEDRFSTPGEFGAELG